MKKEDIITDMLCRTLNLVDKYEQFMDDMNAHNSELQLPDDIYAWWGHHKKVEAEAKQQEQFEKRAKVESIIEEMEMLWRTHGFEEQAIIDMSRNTSKNMKQLLKCEI